MSAPIESDHRDRPGRRVPVTLLSGFLGSGKTTLLSRLLGHARMRDTAVVINEFGEIALDHLLVAKVDAQTVLLDGGCVCCAVRDDLGETLLSLHERHVRGDLPGLDRVVVETSGLADPTAIAALLLRDPALARRFELDAVVITVDCLHAHVQIDEHPEARRQILLADRLLLTKADLVGEDERRRLAARLRELNPAAVQIECLHGDVDPAALVDLGMHGASGLPADVARWHAVPEPERMGGSGGPSCDGSHDHAPGHACRHEAQETGGHGVHGDGVQAHCLHLEEPLDWAVVSSWLGSIAFHHGDRLLRLKAIVDIRGEDRPVAIHGVRQWLNAPEPLPDRPDGVRGSRFVFIVRDLPRMTLVKALEAALREDYGHDDPAHCPDGRFA